MPTRCTSDPHHADPCPTAVGRSAPRPVTQPSGEPNHSFPAVGAACPSIGIGPGAFLHLAPRLGRTFRTVDAACPRVDPPASAPPLGRHRTRGAEKRSTLSTDGACAPRVPLFWLLDRLLGLSEWREQAPHMFDGVLAARTVADLAAEEA